MPLKMGGFYAVGRTTQGFLGSAYTALAGPVPAQNPVFCAPRSVRRALLNAAGQSRVTLSLRQERLRAA